MIELTNIGCSFGDQFALRQISLEVEQGEYWVLLGPSGSGKSMLLHLIAGLFRPDSGRILLDGSECTDQAPEKRQIGMVFQHSALFPHFSVRGNIEYGLKIQKVPDSQRQQAVDRIVGDLKIESILNRPVATLSGGEAQKVAIARALAVKPKVLLLDEPLSPIDYNARLELRQELKRIHSEFNLATIHVTHSREEAQAQGDHCALMLAGKIIQAGTVEQLFAQPSCEWVANFLGSDDGFLPDAPPDCSRGCLSGSGKCDRKTDTGGDGK